MQSYRNLLYIKSSSDGVSNAPDNRICWKVLRISANNSVPFSFYSEFWEILLYLSLKTAIFLFSGQFHNASIVFLGISKKSESFLFFA